MTRRGVSFIEIVLTISVLAGVGLALFTLVNASTTGAARATSRYAASLVLSRLGDRLAAAGYAQLEPLRGRTHPFAWSEERDLEALPSLTTAPRPSANAAFLGAYRIDVIERGLLRVTISLRWGRPGTESKDAASLLAVRYVADATLSLAARDGGVP